MAFYVGQKIVCVDNKPHPRYGPNPLKIGTEYTFIGYAPTDRDGTPGLFIAEHLSGAQRAGNSYGWRVSRFEPAVERKTDTGMAILKKLLVPQKEKV